MSFSGPFLPPHASELVHVALLAASIYLFVLIFFRLFGKRAASKMNNFDWLVTVAMGAVMGATILRRDTALLEGMVAIATLLALQFAVTRASSHSSFFQRIVYASPRLLFYQGVFLTDAMRRERITRSELLGAARAAGHRMLDDVGAIVLEADGTLSVLPSASPTGDALVPTALENVEGLVSAAVK